MFHVRSISSGVDSALADMLKNSFVTKFSAKKTDCTPNCDKIYKFTIRVLQMMGDKNCNGMHITNDNFFFYNYLPESKHTAAFSRFT